MNTPNFPLLELNAQERRQAILRQAQQDQLWATLNRPTGVRLALHSSGLWLRKLFSTLTGAMPKRLPRNVQPKFAEDAG